MSSRRLSSAGGTALRDVSSLHNARSSSVSRRLSLGGSHHGHSGGLAESTPSKGAAGSMDHRRLMLDEWRRQSRKKENEDEIAAISDNYNPNNKRSRFPDGAAPPRPNNNNTTGAGHSSHAASPAFYMEGTGTDAVERIRLRRQMKYQQQLMASYTDDNQINGSSMCYDDSDEVSFHSCQSVGFSGIYAGGTPSSSHRRSGDPRRRSMSVAALAPVARPRNSHAPANFSQESTISTVPSAFNQTVGTLSQLSETDPTVDLVEGAVLREMQQLVDKLQKDKMQLSMAMAPLEASFRQKQLEWEKEQNRLLQEIDSLKEDSRKANERYRDLEAQQETIEEENRQLRFEIRKAAHHSTQLSSLGSSNSGWTRQLQNDRDVTELKEKLRSADEEISSMRLAKVSVEKELHATKIERDSVLRMYDELQEEYNIIAQSKSDNRDAEIKLEVLTTEHIATSAQLNAVCTELAATKARAEAAKEAREAEHKREMDDLLFEMSVLRSRASKAVEMDNVEDEAVLMARIAERDRRIVELEEQLRKGEEQRRMMHNRIQELRGNIRVFVRTRPFLPSDGEGHDSSIDVSLDGESLSILDSRSGSQFGFNFDKVFPPSAGQDMVFKEVADFVQSALDGYHVCLFSYGQTGSGKTHTMQGSGTGAMRGIIPRAVEQILLQAQALRTQKWDYRLSASFLEIYNEELKDLLLAMSNNSSNPTKLSIKRTREGKSYVDGLTEIAINTSDFDCGTDQLGAIMAVAARARSVASTNMNAQSSRSHSVFMLHLRGYNEDSGAEVHGALNLCDLAGSERLDRSGASSDAKRLKETQAINKSLSCLGDVFNALAQRASHVPYRNSKLTYLLQDCLSGDGKALMFVNLSPTIASSNESLCSLRFAQRVNQVELGKPTKHIEYNKKH